MELKEISLQLKAPFKPEQHKIRDLPGGKSQWLYIPWQTIRDRLDEVCPDWCAQYSTPIYLDSYCVVTCTLVICGVAREAIGSVPVTLLSKSGNDMSRGNPVDRAVAEAFKNAAESFGVAAYLDDQERTANWLLKHGDQRGRQCIRQAQGKVQSKISA